jgi:ribosomal protein S18 acetylase RimI-like enzyme
LIDQDGHLLLDNIAVAPEAQGEGLGKKLVAFAESEALRRGFTELRLYTNEKMTENLTLYPRLGFEETHRGRQAGYDRVFFRKRLG